MADETNWAEVDSLIADYEQNQKVIPEAAPARPAYEISEDDVMLLNDSFDIAVDQENKTVHNMTTGETSSLPLFKRKVSQFLAREYLNNLHKAPYGQALAESGISTALRSLRGAAGGILRYLSATSMEPGKDFQNLIWKLDQPTEVEKLFDLGKQIRLADAIGEGNWGGAFTEVMMTGTADVLANFAVIKTLTGMLPGGATGKAGGAIKTLKHAAKFAAIKSIITPGDSWDRAKSAGLGFLYLATPALATHMPSDLTAVATDVLLNMGISKVTGQHRDAINAGVEQAAADGKPNDAWKYVVINLLPIVSTDIGFSLMTRSAQHYNDPSKLLQTLRNETAKVANEKLEQVKQPGEVLAEKAVEAEARPVRVHPSKEATELPLTEKRATEAESEQIGKEILENDPDFPLNLSKYDTPANVVKLMHGLIKGYDEAGLTKDVTGPTRTFEDLDERSTRRLEKILKKKDPFTAIRKDLQRGAREVSKAEVFLYNGKIAFMKLAENIASLKAKGKTDANSMELRDNLEAFAVLYQDVKGLTTASGRLLQSCTYRINGKDISFDEMAARVAGVGDDYNNNGWQVLVAYQQGNLLSNLTSRTVDVFGPAMTTFNKTLEETYAFGLSRLSNDKDKISWKEQQARTWGRAKHTWEAAKQTKNTINLALSELMGIDPAGAARALNTNTLFSSRYNTEGSSGSIAVSKETLKGTLMGKSIDASGKLLDKMWLWANGKANTAQLLDAMAQEGPGAKALWAAIDQMGGVHHLLGFGAMELSDPFYEYSNFRTEADALSIRETEDLVAAGAVSETDMMKVADELSRYAFQLQKNGELPPDVKLKDTELDSSEVLDMVHSIHSRALRTTTEITLKEGFSGDEYGKLSQVYHAVGIKLLNDHPWMRVLSRIYFGTTAGNILRYGVRRTPLARALSKSMADDLNSADPRVKRQAEAKLMVGATYLGLFGFMWHSDMLQGGISWQNYSTAREVKKLRNAVVFPDGTQFSFERFDPDAFFAKLATDVPEAAMGVYEEFLFGQFAMKHVKDAEGNEMLLRDLIVSKHPTVAASAFFNFAMKQPWDVCQAMLGEFQLVLGNQLSIPVLQGLEELAKMKYVDKSLQSAATRRAKGHIQDTLPLSGFMRMLNSLGSDPYFRQLFDVEDVLQEYAAPVSRTLGADENKLNHPYVNLAGEDVLKAYASDAWTTLAKMSNVRFDTLSDEPYAQFMWKYRLEIPGISRRWSVRTPTLTTNYELAPDEYKEIQRSMDTMFNSKGILNEVALKLEADGSISPDAKKVEFMKVFNQLRGIVEAKRDNLPDVQIKKLIADLENSDRLAGRKLQNYLDILSKAREQRNASKQNNTEEH